MLNKQNRFQSWWPNMALLLWVVAVDRLYSHTVFLNKHPLFYDRVSFSNTCLKARQPFSPNSGRPSAATQPLSQRTAGGRDLRASRRSRPPAPRQTRSSRRYFPGIVTGWGSLWTGTPKRRRRRRNTSRSWTWWKEEGACISGSRPVMRKDETIRLMEGVCIFMYVKRMIWNGRRSLIVFLFCFSQGEEGDSRRQGLESTDQERGCGVCHWP